MLFLGGRGDCKMNGISMFPYFLMPPLAVSPSPRLLKTKVLLSSGHWFKRGHWSDFPSLAADAIKQNIKMNLELRDQVGESMQSSECGREVRQCEICSSPISSNLDEQASDAGEAPQSCWRTQGSFSVAELKLCQRRQSGSKWMSTEKCTFSFGACLLVMLQDQSSHRAAASLHCSMA